MGRASTVGENAMVTPTAAIVPTKPIAVSFIILFLPLLILHFVSLSLFLSLSLSLNINNTKC